MDSSDQTQNQTFVVEISSTEYDVSELSYFFGDIWYVFLGKVETVVETIKPRGTKPGLGEKPIIPKKVTTKYAVALIDGYSMNEVRRYFKVRRLHVFVPYRDSGFTNTMFVPMNCLTDYVKEQVFLAKEAKKHEIKELEALRKEFEVSLRAKMQTMVKYKFFEDKDFDVSVVIQPRKNYAVFAFINFYDVPEYDMGLASMILRQQPWEFGLPGNYIETRFSKVKPQNDKQNKK
jgi:hypothetical protein